MEESVLRAEEKDHVSVGTVDKLASPDIQIGNRKQGK